MAIRRSGARAISGTEALPMPGQSGCDENGIHGSKLLLEGKTNRIVCTHAGGVTDMDMDEGLATKKTIQSIEVDVLGTMTGI